MTAPAWRTVDPLRVRLEPLDGGYVVVLDDEDVGHIERDGDRSWSGPLLGSTFRTHGPGDRKGLHAAVCSAIPGLLA